MSDLVDSSVIEGIVGATRHPELHIGRAVSREETVYILHSGVCRDSGVDLRECRFSIALDDGIDETVWAGYEDRPVTLGITIEGELVPAVTLSGITAGGEILG